MTVSGYKCIGSRDKVNSHVLLTLILCYGILSYAGRSDLAVSSVPFCRHNFTVNVSCFTFHPALNIGQIAFLHR